MPLEKLHLLCLKLCQVCALCTNVNRHRHTPTNWRSVSPVSVAVPSLHLVQSRWSSSAGLSGESPPRGRTESDYRPRIGATMRVEGRTMVGDAVCTLPPRPPRCRPTAIGNCFWLTRASLGDRNAPRNPKISPKLK